MEEPKAKLVTEKIVVPIDLIIANPWNPNSMPQHLFEKMKAVIKEKGLFGSVIVRKLAGYYEILDGEHRTKACKELGWKEIPVECAVDEMEEKDVKFWTIYFNNMRGKDDVEKRAKLLNELDSGQAQLLPMTADEIHNEKELIKFDFNKYKDNLPTVEDEKEKFRIIIIDVPEDVFKVWQGIKKDAAKDGHTELQVLNEMMDGYCALHFGRKPDSSEQVF